VRTRGLLLAKGFRNSKQMAERRTCSPTKGAQPNIGQITRTHPGSLIESHAESVRRLEVDRMSREHSLTGHVLIRAISMSKKLSAQCQTLSETCSSMPAARWPDVPIRLHFLGGFI
jgi:hypothetical protein